MKLDKRITPLTVILILGIGFWGVVIGAWYWTSTQPYSFELSVAGWMSAKVINPEDLYTLDPQTVGDMLAMPVATDMDLVEGKNTLYILCIETNAVNHQMTVTATIPAGVTLEAKVKRVWWRNEIPGINHDLDIDVGIITVFSGTQILMLDGTMFTQEPDPDPDLGDYKLIEITFTANLAGCPPGSYSVSDILITMGDSV